MTKSKARQTRLEGEQDLFGPGRGGRREGAGRPPIGDAPRVTKSFSMPSSMAFAIEHLADELGISQSELIAQRFEASLTSEDYDAIGRSDDRRRADRTPV